MNTSLLNQQQLKAVIDPSQDILVLAGAGTGKTRVLTSRVEYLISKGVHPSSILCFTFTKKAAGEMKWRLKKSLPENTTESISVSTFHSFMVPFVLENLNTLGFTSKNINIISESDSRYFINQVIEEMKPNFTNKELRAYISNIKNRTDLPKLSIEQEAQLLNCYNRYQELLKKRNTIDMDDIILFFYESLKNESFLEFIQGYHYILVDECQDTNPLQYEILKLIRGENNNLFMVGDDDQSIYSFRGADPFVIKKYIEEYNPTQIILDKNYRSLPGVVQASTHLIKNNVNRVDKVYSTVRKKEAMMLQIACYNNRHEGIQLCSIIQQFHDNGYEYKDIAVLFRNNSLADHLEPYLLKYNIPHTKIRTNFLECEEIKTVINYYRFLNDEDNDIYLTNLLQNKIFGFDPSYLLKLKNEAKTYHESLFNVFKFHDEEHPATKYFLDQYFILKNEYNYLSILDFYQRLLEIIGFYPYYSEKENGSVHLMRLEAFKEFLDSDNEANPKQAAIRIINNIMIDSNMPNDSLNNQVQFMTIHQAKGLEFPIVIIPGLEEGIMPSYKAKSPLQIEEERRILYVGISRAKDNCILMYNKKRFLYGQEHIQKESRFLMELKE